MKLINAETVALKLGVSATTVYNLQRRDPTFPRAVRLSKRATRWSEEEIENWVNSKNKGENDETGSTDREVRAGAGQEGRAEEGVRGAGEEV